jgi:2-keto-4-pentenoate hydratase
MLINRSGEIVETGVGASVLGHPAHSVAWLANKLATFGISLEPGEIVPSGSIGKAVPAGPGDTFVVEVHGQAPVTVAFT